MEKRNDSRMQSNSGAMHITLHSVETVSNPNAKTFRIEIP